MSTRRGFLSLLGLGWVMDKHAVEVESLAAENAGLRAERTQRITTALRADPDRLWCKGDHPFEDA